MQSRRIAAATITLAGAALVLSGCQAPNPSVTVFSGTTSANREALCWSPEPNRAFEPSDCLISEDDLSGQGNGPSEQALAELVDYLAIIDVVPEGTVGISVDPEVAEAGWSITLNGKPLSRELVTSTYYRFSLSERAFRQGPIEMRVFGSTDDGEFTRGYWVFQLSPASTTPTA